MSGLYIEGRQRKVGTCSESGPQIKGPTQNPATKRDIGRTPTSWERLNSFFRDPVTPTGAELANVLNERSRHELAELSMVTHALRIRIDDKMVMYHLFSRDQF